jgi:hypothetical protein
MHGVDAMTISFGRIRAIEIPVLQEPAQSDIERQYLLMSKQHDRAMAIKDRLLDESGIEPGQYGEGINALASQNATYRRSLDEAQKRLKHLIAEIEALLDGNLKKIRPFAD